MPAIPVTFNHGVGLGHENPSFLADSFGLDLIVHPLAEDVFVVFKQVLEVAPIETEDSRTVKLLRPGPGSLKESTHLQFLTGRMGQVTETPALAQPITGVASYPYESCGHQQQAFREVNHELAEYALSQQYPTCGGS